MEREKVLVTSALPYANGPIHLGHLSGAYLPADIYVRYKRLKNDDIIYVCGSDEHGVPITISADKENVSPKVIIDRYHEQNRIAFEKFGMSFDIYSRTSIKKHHDTAQEFFKNYYNNNLLNEKKSNHFYDNKSKMFLPDRYVEGTCPRCGYDEARSDECENCGSLYDPEELINPVSKISGERPELKETSHFYFSLGKYQDFLEKYIDEMNSKYGWKENVLQYCRGWFKDGLKDRAVTRDLDWGVPVPLKDLNGKVIYVWFEAVLGYISATKVLSEEKGDSDLWKRYWHDPKTKYIAFIGKDNIVFHTIIFPAMLKAWNDSNEDQYIYPQNVPANEFLNFEGKKFSKSRGWGIDVDEFLNLFPADSLRYTLACNLPENKDTDFFWKEFQAKNNNELADILGNFINRTFIFTQKHFENKVPVRGKLSDFDNDMINKLRIYPQKVSKLLENFKIRDAVLEMMNLSRAANKYFNDSEPWKFIKTSKEQCGTTINICLQTIYSLAELFYPVIPFSSRKIFNMLKAEPDNWDKLNDINLKEGHHLGESQILFEKIEDGVIQIQLDRLPRTTEDDSQEEEITYDEFSKIKLKIAKISAVEEIQKSKKLLKIKVQVGEKYKQVIAGIAQSYSPEELLDKNVVIVSNLRPVKIIGELSEGMILAVENSEGNLEILEVSKDVTHGTVVK